jgi:quercetin dioxygenase-like cupin family protein
MNLRTPDDWESPNPGLPAVETLGCQFEFLTQGIIVRSRLSVPAILGALIAMQSATAAYAAPAAKDTQVLERVDVNGTNREMGMGVSEFPPNAEKPRHMATGPEVCYVMRGEIILQVEGRPVKVIRAGGSFQIAANAIHVTKAGPAGATVIATWVSTPRKPFNVRVPQ